MGKDTGIEWCHHTFNPWWGCVKVSPACKHCYAETFAKRVGQKVWGEQAPRRFFAAAHWAEPLKWNAAADKVGERQRVFCASMADVFEDRRDLDGERRRLWDLIAQTPSLDWLLLTKRPENIRVMVPRFWLEQPLRNVWYGATAENQDELDRRTRHLIAVPAAVRFLSCEPLLEQIDFRQDWERGLDGTPWEGACERATYAELVNWVIVGSESGPGARPMDIAWARSVVDQCRAAGTAVFVKQIANERDRKGGNPEFWPPGEWPRQFPEVRR